MRNRQGAKGRDDRSQSPDWTEAFGTALGRNQPLTRVLAIAAIVIAAAYLTARLLFTMQGAVPWAFWLLFLAEAFTLVSLLLHAFDTWRFHLTPEPPLATLTTDIVIATYNEDPEILEPTILASTRVRGVNDVWVLDDGRRPWVELMCERLGARYSSRSTNEHAKAGNINASLDKFDGDLLLFLDADHVPQRNAITAMSGFFDDPSVAVVQTPHDFRNLDSAQQRSLETHEQSLFFDVILPGRDRHDAAFWCGSGAILRKQALIEVGGVAVETVSEDLHSTLRMQKAGYHVVYLNRRLTNGLAPHDLDSYLLQRDRWARGTLAVLTSKDSPVFTRGWSISQRLHYVSSLLHYFIGLQRMAFIASLVVVLGFGVLPVGELPWWVFVLAVVNIVASTVATLGLARGRTGLGDGVENAWLTAETFLKALVGAVTRRTIPFRVTPKDVQQMTGEQIAYRLRLPIAALTALAVVWLLRTINEFTPVTLVLGSIDPWLYFVISVFGVWEGWLIFALLRRELRRRQLRMKWRFATETPGCLGGQHVTIIDIHEDGLMCEGPTALESGETVPVTVRALVDGQATPAQGLMTIRRVTQVAPEVSRYAGTVEWDSPVDRWNVLDFCYVELAGKDRQHLVLESEVARY